MSTLKEKKIEMAFGEVSVGFFYVFVSDRDQVDLVVVVVVVAEEVIEEEVEEDLEEGEADAEVCNYSFDFLTMKYLCDF